MEQLQKKKGRRVEDCPGLSPEDKKLFNLLQIRLYDLSQNLQLIGRQLTNNQIKDIVSQTYQLSNQLSNIFQHGGVPFLFDLQRKMQVNSVLICSILTDRLQTPSKTQNPCTCQSQAIPFLELALAAQNKSPQKLPQNSKMPVLGGIHLYNQTHQRGLPRQKADDKNVRKGEESQTKMFVNSLLEQIDNKAEVQVDSIAEEIKSYILNFKESNKVANFISCETQLNQIIDFFKVSQLQAVDFLNKSPKGHHQYTQDFLNRLSDLESDVRTKNHSGKDQIVDKMKLFVVKLKEKMERIEHFHEEKKTKLAQYEKSLKRVSQTMSTQTYDGWGRKQKELQNKLKEQEQRFDIINQIRKTQNIYQNEIHKLTHIVQLKINQNNKLGNMNLELEQEMKALKKIFRDKNQAVSLLEPELTRRKLRQITNKNIKSRRQMEGYSPKDMRHERKVKKLEKTVKNSQRSFLQSSIKEVQLNQGYRNSRSMQRQFEDGQSVKYDLNFSRMKSNEYDANNEAKQSVFGVQARRSNNVKRTVDDDKQVSFKVTPSKNSGFTQRLDTQVYADIMDNIKERQGERSSRSLFSIEGQRLQLDGGGSRRSNKKNILRQKVDSGPTSFKQIQWEQGKKSSSKIQSKKCIILRDNKQKSSITAIIKMTHFDISQQYSLIIGTQKKTQIPSFQQSKRKGQRVSHNYSLNSKQKNVENNNRAIDILRPKDKAKVKKQVKKKKNPSNPSTHNDPDDQKLESIKSIQNKDEEKEEKVRKAITRNKIQQKIKLSKNNEYSSFQRVNQQSSKPQLNSKLSGIRSPVKIQQLSFKTYTEQKERQKTFNPFNTKEEGLQSKMSLEKLSEISQGPSQLPNGIYHKSKRHSESSFQSTAKLSTKFKDIASTLQKLKSGNNGREQKNHSEEQKIKIKQILEELQKEHLDVNEFQEIMIEMSKQQEYDNRKVSCKQQPSINKAKSINSFTKDQKESIYKHLSTPHQESFWSPKDKPQNKDLISRISSIHQQFSKCSSSHPCQHIHAYFRIIEKVNQDLSISHKVSLKLPIQHIGHQDRFGKEIANAQRPQDKTGKRFTHSYLKSHITTDQQKPRILPLISNTTSSYYKPKSKVIR